MEYFGTFLAAIFIALLIGAGLSFGFMLLVWFLSLALLMCVFTVLRNVWRRWRFLHHAEKHASAGQIIEGEYKNISVKEDKL